MMHDFITSMSWPKFLTVFIPFVVGLIGGLIYEDIKTHGID